MKPLLLTTFMGVGIFASCSREAQDVHTAPKGRWAARRIVGNSAVCTFPWVIDIEYRDGNITYTDPQVQEKPLLLVFAGLDTDHPKLVTRDASGANDEGDLRAYRTDHKISMVRISPSEKNAFAYTLDLDSGIGILTEHAPWFLGKDPRGRMGMGTCE